MLIHGRQHLLIDADDTLWENNIYFEDAFDEFVRYLDHSSLTAAEVRAVLDEIEIANVKIHGYGAANFARNLAQCYERLAEREIRPDDLRVVMAFAERILEHPMELIAGVEETLAYLAPRHELTLFTKGHPEEQKLKIDRSGLDRHFHHSAIVREKDAGAYATLVKQRDLDSTRTWMVGNSPKSDINPALAAGLKAVYVPHSRTWGLEREEIQEARGQLLILETFADLQRHF
jgi:putative hydrolase of the HAD superfamily